MSNASFVIVLSSPRSQTDLGRFKKDTSEAREECHALAKLFERLAGGLETGSLAVYTSAAAPVVATNTVTVTYSSMTNGDTVVIGSTTLTAETGTPSGQAQFKMATSTTVTSANLIACINAHATLSLLMVATGGGAGGVITLTLYAPGKLGNQVPLVGSTGMVAGAATFTSGAGGIETAAVNYARS